MKSTAFILTTTFWSLTLAASLEKREVPQEHSHEKYLRITDKFLKMDNTIDAIDAVFGLLGNQAAEPKKGKVNNVDCLHRSIADVAFTNAKKKNDIEAMTGILIYAALEKNTGKVGLKSATCMEKAVNPEISAIEQHQDPASENAPEENKKIVLELARQIKSVGGDPFLALESGTFKPGDKEDQTARGNSCDDKDDPIGCIFTKKLLVEDASRDEILTAIGGSTKTGNNDDSSDKGNDEDSKDEKSDNDNSNDTTDERTDESTDNNTKRSISSLTSRNRQRINRKRNTTQSEKNDGSDFGSCTKPTITFADGFDGRMEKSFKADNQVDFNHGSTVGMKITAEFICMRLESSCKAPAATIQKCKDALVATEKLTGEAAANKFNEKITA